MVFIDCMRRIAIINGYVPINPEYALGYYLSTTSHDGNKSEVMKDCLSLAMAADEFWLFTESEDIVLQQLSEGILIEMLLWVRTKPAKVRAFSISETVKSLNYHDHAKYEGRVLNIDEPMIRRSLENNQFGEISGFLDKIKYTLRPIVFIDIRNEDFKYIDWVRAYAYLNGKIPISPQHLTPKFIYSIHNMQENYQSSIEKLRDVASETWAIYHSDTMLQNIKERYSLSSRVTFISMQEVGVPKYTTPRSWPITSKEVKENLP
ncbi:hypothetical protein KJ673_00010 [Patescibacteria group bacterium]|nr:hypothetical protein [Patescibacteria group bacterium]